MARRGIKIPMHLAIGLCNALTDDQLGKLLRAVFKYAKSGEEPDFEEDQVMDVAWGYSRSVIFNGD